MPSFINQAAQRDVMQFITACVTVSEPIPDNIDELGGDVSVSRTYGTNGAFLLTTTSSALHATLYNPIHIRISRPDTNAISHTIMFYVVPYILSPQHAPTRTASMRTSHGEHPFTDSNTHLLKAGETSKAWLALHRCLRVAD